MNPLTNWINHLRQQGHQLVIHDGTIQLRGAALQRTDQPVITRHRHALTVAAQGSHPDWWNTVLGNQPPHPDLDLPWTCATCGHPATHLDPTLLGWCDQHVNLEAL